MTPERYRQINELFKAASDRDPEARPEFLAELCAGDNDLQQEVEAMLSADAHPGGFLEQPPGDLAADLLDDATETQASPGTLLGHYRIERLLAAGGMARVFQAVDTRLGRKVAIKICAEQFSGRFKREARTISLLSHPHVCTLHDVGPNYLVMELVEGETLRDWFQHAHPLEQGLDVAKQVLDALGAAHRAGIVHRDLKPENIMVRFDGCVKVLDFGLAKMIPAFGASRHDGNASAASQPGQVIGTAAYMSPEQIQGEEIDQRSDLFSFGTILYEILTGRHPWRGKSPVDTMHAILHDEPPGINATSPVAAELAAVARRLLRKKPAERYPAAEAVLQALEKEPGWRFQNALELQAPLTRCRDSGVRRTLWMGAAALLLLGVILPVTWRTASQGEIRSLAVLPLENRTGNSEQDHLADGISEAIAGDLSGLRGLRIIARTSVTQYKGAKKKPPEIARDLNVDAILTGSIAASAQRTQVRVQLTRANTGRALWAESYDLDLGDIRKVQSQVSRAVVRGVHLRFSREDEARLAKAGTVNREAFEAYLRGRHYWNKRTDADIRRAIGYFRAAIDADPAFGAAYAALADSYNQLGTVLVGQSPLENRGLAIAAAKKALEIDGQLAEAHAALGFANLYNWDWAGADVELRLALDLNPSYASARVWYAMYLTSQRRFAEAIAEVERARDLDPLSPITQTQVGFIYKLAGRDEKAIAQLRKVLAVNPDYDWAVWQLGSSLLDTDRTREALEVLEKGVQVSRNNPSMLGKLGQAYAMSGRRAEARQMLARLEKMSQERYVTPIAGVNVCLGLDDRDCFFRYLEEAYRQRANYIAMLSVMPSPRRFPSLRSDPRFQDMLRRLGYDTAQ